MGRGNTARASVTIQAPAAKVWHALTDPDLIRQYLFGTQARSDWKEGSPVTYSGEWEGKRYVDKGTVLKVDENRLLQSTYWSALSGKPDAPENYSTVTYTLDAGAGGTTLTVEQDNNPSEESARHAEGNWDTVLRGMKKLLE
jgi:uncharacterized protein YndB with AHSA1/START domain